MRPSRRDYQDYIQWLNIPQDKSDPLAILARSGGHKATDTFEVFPYPEKGKDGVYHLHFFVHGLRYMPECSIERVNPAPTPIQFRLLCNMNAKWSDDFVPFSSQDYQPIIDSSLLLNTFY